MGTEPDSGELTAKLIERVTLEIVYKDGTRDVLTVADREGEAPIRCDTSIDRAPVLDEDIQQFGSSAWQVYRPGAMTTTVRFKGGEINLCRGATRAERASND